jgi:hypothetical protein
MYATLAVAALLAFPSYSAATVTESHTQNTPPACTAKAFREFSADVWNPSRWSRGMPPGKIIAAERKMLACAGPGNRVAMKHRWAVDRHAYFVYRHMIMARNIDHRWAAHWAPDYSGPTLPFNVAAALFEAAGMPGVTMAQVAKGESGLRPGSAGVDPGGTVGYGTLAVTSPFADSIVGRLGGYNEMLNPVKNAAAAAEIYHSNGLGAWYGTGYVTGTNLHYHGHLDLRKYLGGLSFRQAVRR